MGEQEAKELESGGELHGRKGHGQTGQWSVVEVGIARLTSDHLPNQAFRYSMSDALPPLRISATASSSLTSTLVQAKLGAFLASYGDRMKKGGDSTVTAQLHKLQEALEEEKLHRTAKVRVTPGGS